MNFAWIISQNAAAPPPPSEMPSSMSPQLVSLFVAVGRKMYYANLSSHQMKVGVNCGKIVKLIKYVPTTKYPNYVWKHFIKHSRIYPRYRPCLHWAIGMLYGIYGAKAGLSLRLSSAGRVQQLSAAWMSVCDAGAALQLLSQVAVCSQSCTRTSWLRLRQQVSSSLCATWMDQARQRSFCFPTTCCKLVNKGTTELRELWRINSSCSHRS